MTINLISIKERIAISDAFTPEERNLILKAINHYSAIHDAKRNYPSNHRPGPHAPPFVNMAWAVLDDVPQAMLDDTARFFIAGLVAGALSEMERIARTHAAMAKQ